MKRSFTLFKYQMVSIRNNPMTWKYFYTKTISLYTLCTWTSYITSNVIKDNKNKKISTKSVILFVLYSLVIAAKEREHLCYFGASFNEHVCHLGANFSGFTNFPLEKFLMQSKQASPVWLGSVIILLMYPSSIRRQYLKLIIKTLIVK